MNRTLVKRPKMNETENDISLNRRSELRALMNQRLASAVACALSIFGQEARTTINTATALDAADTAHPFTEISRGIGKWFWFVEAHSQGSK